jgi:hypothetical protein
MGWLRDPVSSSIFLVCPENVSFYLVLWNLHMFENVSGKNKNAEIRAEENPGCG